ncbi:MAG TPA: hypothetical protein VHS96_09305, partial [Bacteroidia bacterium]|nr:hypothetical protein [Bacteroidia bacterium]
AQYERRNFYLPTSGFRKYAGTDGDDLGNHWPTYSDSLFLRRGDPFVYVTGQVYAPLDPALDFRPEFLTPGSMNEDSLLWPPTAEVVHNGMFCLHTIPTDTVDMQGGKVKTLRLHPVIRYPQGDTIAEWRDTIEVYVVNKR